MTEDLLLLGDDLNFVDGFSKPSGAFAPRPERPLNHCLP